MALLFSGGSFSAAAVVIDSATDTSSNVASSSSTPPTTVADSDSQHSDISKHDVITVADDAADAAPVDVSMDDVDLSSQGLSPPASRRTGRARASVPVYNLSKLSGTADHGKRRAKGDEVADRRRRTISGDTLVGSIEVGLASSRTTRDKTLKAGIDALDLQWSPGSLSSPRTRRQARLSPRPPLRSSSRRSGAVSSLATTLASMGKRGKKVLSKGVTRMSRELMRLQDTKEFTGIEDKPVVHTVWSNGKFVDPNAPPTPPRKKAKVEEPDEEAEEEDSEPITNTKARRVKKYLDKGLYAGQDMPLDIYKGLTLGEKKKLVQLPELIPSGRVNKTMPPPIYTGLRMLIAGRDFRLPFNTCNPLPPGQPKPDEWKKMTKSTTNVLDVASGWFWEVHFANRKQLQIDLSVIPRITGARCRICMISPSVCASRTMAVATTAKTESCCTSAIMETATSARSYAPTDRLRTYKLGGPKAASTVLVSRSSRRQIAAVVSAVIAASSQTRLLWSIRVKLSPRRSASVA